MTRTTAAIMPNDPKTPVEWQEAVDTANFLLGVDSARMYGLLEGGPAVNVTRCEEILQRGRDLGYQPKPIQKLSIKFSGGK